MHDLIELMHQRHSERAAYDPSRPLSESELGRLLEAARWAPTAHNMQDFEVVVVDDPAILGQIGVIATTVSATFLRENYQQLSFSEEELRRRKTGVLARQFPPAWVSPEPNARALAPRLLADSMRGCPALLVVLYDPRRRAPASEGDVLGVMSLGCLMQNLWLAAEDAGIAMQILSAFSSTSVAAELSRVLALPSELRIAFACRLGHPVTAPEQYVRVRREIADFAHRNRYGRRIAGASTQSGAGTAPPAVPIS
jgi:nitroreductase